MKSEEKEYLLKAMEIPYFSNPNLEQVLSDIALDVRFLSDAQKTLHFFEVTSGAKNGLSAQEQALFLWVSRFESLCIGVGALVKMLQRT